jgi:hypothetical protein
MSRIWDQWRAEKWQERAEYGLDGRRPPQDRWCVRRWVNDGDMPSAFFDAAVWYEGRLEAASGCKGSGPIAERVQGGSNGQEKAYLEAIHAGNEQASARMAVWRFAECKPTLLVFDALFEREDGEDILPGRPSLDALARRFGRRKAAIKAMAMLSLEGLANYRERTVKERELWVKRGGLATR